MVGGAAHKGVVLLIAPWVYYSIKWRKNAHELLARDGILAEWELNYITHKRRRGTGSG
jgi:hypothetical protein